MHFRAKKTGGEANGLRAEERRPEHQGSSDSGRNAHTLPRLVFTLPANSIGILIETAVAKLDPAVEYPWLGADRALPTHGTGHVGPLVTSPLPLQNTNNNNQRELDQAVGASTSLFIHRKAYYCPRESSDERASGTKSASFFVRLRFHRDRGNGKGTSGKNNYGIR